MMCRALFRWHNRDVPLETLAKMIPNMTLGQSHGHEFCSVALATLATIDRSKWHVCWFQVVQTFSFCINGCLFFLCVPVEQARDD